MAEVKQRTDKNLELLSLQALDVVKVGPSAWSEIAGMRAQKDLIEKKILLPLENQELAKKHGVILPKAILLFGPPGTGKTSFAKGIAGRLGWLFIEISPSELINEGADFEAQQLKKVFSKLDGITDAVVFIDEFEELAIHPEKATKMERMISNEMLKQVPRFRQNQRVMLVCATNYIHHLNPALLRPGRFDYVLPIGPLDADAAEAVYKSYLKKLNSGNIDYKAIVSQSAMFTPADIEAAIAQVAQIAFEKELFDKKDYKVSTKDVLNAVKLHKPTVSEEDFELFKKDIHKFGRCTSGCIHCFAAKEPYDGPCLRY